MAWKNAQIGTLPLVLLTPTALATVNRVGQHSFYFSSSAFSTYILAWRSKDILDRVNPVKETTIYSSEGFNVNSYNTYREDTNYYYQGARIVFNGENLPGGSGAQFGESTFNVGAPDVFGLSILIDEDNHLAEIVYIYTGSASLYWVSSISTLSQRGPLYDLLKNYNRQSLELFEAVSSISGKGKNYQLSRIATENINYGAVVNGASESAFTVLNDESKMDVIINSIAFDMTKVVVNYTIPTGNYSYIKLVYKKNSIPKDYEDGTAIDILTGSTSKIISGICDGSKYWFVIFTDITSSDAVELQTTNENE